MFENDFKRKSILHAISTAMFPERTLHFHVVDEEETWGTWGKVLVCLYGIIVPKVFGDAFFGVVPQ